MYIYICKHMCIYSVCVAAADGVSQPLNCLSLCLLSGGRVCHSFIPGMRNNNAGHPVSYTHTHAQTEMKLTKTFCDSAPDWFNRFLQHFFFSFSSSYFFSSFPCFIRMVQQEQTFHCSPGTHWQPLTSFDRPVMPATVG